MKEFFRIRIKTYLKKHSRAISIGFLIFLFLTASFFSPLLLNIFKQVAPLEKAVEKFIQPKPILATYQFVPVSGNLVVGNEQTITAATAKTTEGVNVGSWKGTLANDDFHWVVGGTASGVDVQLNVGGAQLNGANKLIIQTEIDVDATRLATLVQICDWVDPTNVDNEKDDYCTGGGWRTLNTKSASQVAVAYDPSDNAADALQWHIYNGYWSTGTTGGTPISTPLTNFINGSNQIKIRYYSTTDTTSQIAIDYLRVYAVIDPVYFPGDFAQDLGDTPAGHYAGAVMMGNTAAGQQTTTGDVSYLQVPGTNDVPADFYLKFKNIKTYTGMNTILINTDTSCSVATPDLQYRFKIRNFNSGQWEEFASIIDCSTTDYFSNFAKNNITISNYINASNEIWIGMHALSSSTTALKIDHMYIMLGTTNTDADDCEISFGSNIAGRIAINPSSPGSDRINAMAIDSSYMYLAGYDSSGIDNEWRLEKRNLSDGELVIAFDDDGIVTNDPTTLTDQILAIATTSDAVFVAGYDSLTGSGTGTAGQWRIEKRDITDGSLMTAFDSDGIITYNPVADVDEITAIAVDSSYLYVAGFQDDDSGVWRIHKYDIIDGSLVIAFDDDGIITETLAATGNERPQAIAVDSNYLYVAGFDNVAGNLQWRIEKRNKTTGDLCDGVVNCAADAFDTDGIIQTNPSVGIDIIYAMEIDGSFIYLGGYDLAAGAGQWRIEKRNIADGSLVNAFDDDGIIQIDPTTGVDIIFGLTIDSNYLYLAGAAGAGAWRIEKRNITTGLLDPNFGSDGIGQSEDGGDDQPRAIAVNGSYVYIAGYGTAPGDNQWLIEKRDISTGLRTNDSFGSNDCTGTRDLDTVAGNRNSWAIQTEDESTDFSHPFYALDNDGDAVVEEAGSANIGFSVNVPSNAAVTGIFWAGRHMSGAAGTVRHAIKDFSGLTGTIGGRSSVGSNGTTLMIYTDPIVAAGVDSGGAAGYMTNPEDYIDTVNNKMRLNLNTTADGATNVNSVNVWDFAMVSIQWIEAGVVNQAPTVSNVKLNNQTNIDLMENSTSSVSATADISDSSGCSTITNVSAKIYRSGVTNGKDCTVNENNCYSVASCTENSCVENNATYTCTIDMQFDADPTDDNTPWTSEYWRTYIEATDGSLTGSGYSPTDAPDVNSLLALDVTNSINYGSLDPSQKNDPLDKITTVTATGNVSLDITLYGTNMCTDYPTCAGNTIPVGKQKYALSASTAYSSGTSLLVDPGAEAELNCPKTTDSSNKQTKDIWWGIEIPNPQAVGSYTGQNTFIGVKSETPWP